MESCACHGCGSMTCDSKLGRQHDHLVFISNFIGQLKLPYSFQARMRNFYYAGRSVELRRVAYGDAEKLAEVVSYSIDGNQ